MYQLIPTSKETCTAWPNNPCVYMLCMYFFPIYKSLELFSYVVFWINVERLGWIEGTYCLKLLSALVLSQFFSVVSLTIKTEIHIFLKQCLFSQINWFLTLICSAHLHHVLLRVLWNSWMEQKLQWQRGQSMKTLFIQLTVHPWNKVGDQSLRASGVLMLFTSHVKSQILYNGTRETI